MSSADKGVIVINDKLSTTIKCQLKSLSCYSCYILMLQTTSAINYVINPPSAEFKYVGKTYLVLVRIGGCNIIWPRGYKT